MRGYVRSGHILGHNLREPGGPAPAHEDYAQSYVLALGIGQLASDQLGEADVIMPANAGGLSSSVSTVKFVPQQPSQCSSQA